MQVQDCDNIAPIKSNLGSDNRGVQSCADNDFIGMLTKSLTINSADHKENNTRLTDLSSLKTNTENKVKLKKAKNEPLKSEATYIETKTYTTESENVSKSLEASKSDGYNEALESPTEKEFDPQSGELAIHKETENNKHTLVQEQAKYIDDKLGHDEKLQINVSVNEVKVAEQSNKELLQNSFVLTSMLQEDAENITDLNNEISGFNDPDAAIVIDDGETIRNPDDISVVSSAKTGHLDNLVITNNLLWQNSVYDAKSLSNDNINSDVALKSLSKEVIEQVKVNITQNAVKGVDTIDIHLKPEGLGKVVVHMIINKDGRLHADIVTSRMETADLLQREVADLSKSFQEAGYDTDKQSFNFSFSGDQQANRKNDGHNFQKFIGETLEQENDPAVINDNWIYDPRYGLNIKV